MWAPGIGEGANWGTFPLDMEAQALLSCVHWVKVIRMPDAGETITEGIHYERFAEFQPQTLIFHDSTAAHPGDTLGLCGGTYFTLTPSVLEFQPEDVESPRCPEVDDVPTPPTPPAGWR